MAAPAQPVSAVVLSPSHVSCCFFTANTVSKSRAAAAAVVRRRRSTTERSSIGCSGGEAVVAAVEQELVVTMKATVTGKASFGAGAFLSHMGVDGVRDDIADLSRKSLLLELVSSELDPKTGEEKLTITTEATYEATFAVPALFGPIGAVLVENEHHREMFIKDIVLTDGSASVATAADVVFECNSWVHSKFDDRRKRAFFPLKSFRGDGHGERKSFEHIYDYDMYNNLGNPDKDMATRCSVLGGKDHPYPHQK